MKLTILSAVFCLAFAASAQTGDKLKAFNLTDKTVAIEGYDPVAYFTEGKPIKGSKANQFQHEGITYYFSNTQNQQSFANDPSRYEPQYGGWCAFAMGQNGEKVEVDPETFKIVDGKLYLFYNRFFNNTLTSWNKNEIQLKAKADINWARHYKNNKPLK